MRNDRHRRTRFHHDRLSQEILRKHRALPNHARYDMPKCLALFFQAASAHARHFAFLESQIRFRQCLLGKEIARSDKNRIVNADGIIGKRPAIRSAIQEHRNVNRRSAIIQKPQRSFYRERNLACWQFHVTRWFHKSHLATACFALVPKKCLHLLVRHALELSGTDGL